MQANGKLNSMPFGFAVISLVFVVIIRKAALLDRRETLGRNVQRTPKPINERADAFRMPRHPFQSFAGVDSLDILDRLILSNVFGGSVLIRDHPDDPLARVLSKRIVP
jgi:hypothetical protein